MGFTDVPSENPDSDEAAEDDDAARENQELGEGEGAPSIMDNLRQEAGKPGAPKKKKKKEPKKAP